MATRYQITATGGPDVLTRVEEELSPPPPGFAQVKLDAIGLNYIDTYHRTGLYPLPLPTTLGVEGAGIVTAVGDGVENVKIGQRVAYAGPPATYASEAHLVAALLVPLPDDVSSDLAAASWLKGMTARYLLKATYPVKAGDTILIHAAAGGVGLIVCQWAKALGCTVIGTAGSPEKAELARAHGCDHPILYNEVDFVEAVMDLTQGQGVPVVYDSVGKATVPKSVMCLKPRGMLVSFGNASGLPDPIGFDVLGARGSLFVTRPSLFNYIATPDELSETANDFLDVLQNGTVKVEVRQSYGLDDVVQAHKDIEARKTTGSTILFP
ncbi:MAG: quinone oxidoreductase family protein [Alphaproteobacteria bacterium]